MLAKSTCAGLLMGRAVSTCCEVMGGQDTSGNREGREGQEGREGREGREVGRVRTVGKVGKGQEGREGREVARVGKVVQAVQPLWASGLTTNATTNDQRPT